MRSRATQHWRLRIIKLPLEPIVSPTQSSPGAPHNSPPHASTPHSEPEYCAGVRSEACRSGGCGPWNSIR